MKSYRNAATFWFLKVPSTDPVSSLSSWLRLSSWNEWLRLPVKYPDLPQSAQVALTVWDIYGPGRAVPVGGTTVTLFGKYG